MKRSARTASSIFRRHLAALAVITAGMGCSSVPDEVPLVPDAAPPVPDAAPSMPDELPLVPCGIEEQSIEGTLRSYVQLGYDEQGNLISREERNAADDSVSVRHSWQYRSDGKLVFATQENGEGPVREVTLQYDANRRLSFVTWRAYDDEGRVLYEYRDAQYVIEFWDRDNDGLVEDMREYRYDSDGNLQSFTVTCDGEAEPREITNLRWNSDGQIGLIATQRNGEQTGLTEYFYNAEGGRERVEYSGIGTLTAYTEEYELDEDGNVRKMGYRASLDTPDIQSSERTAEYDAEGRILSEVFAPDAIPRERHVYLYECPDQEDSPGRRLGTPAPVAAPPPQGPLGGVGTDAIDVYTYDDYRCGPSSAAAPSRR